MRIPRMVIAGLSGGSGKTLVSLGLVRAFLRRGFDVQPFKKGPDYIDAAWLEMAANRACATLDPWFSGVDFLRGHLARCCLDWGKSERPLALIEGNRGLFDGKDARGTCSTANLAVGLQAPVIVVINCAKMTRTVAAIVGGLRTFQPELNLGGVILNNVGTGRQAALLRESIELYTDVPVMGCLPRLEDNPLPERHMGLRLFGERSAHDKVLDKLANYLEEYVDLDAVFGLAAACPELPVPQAEKPWELARRPRIGYVKDDAIWFYYQENLQALEKKGAELVRLSLLDPAPWPEIDGLYLGGGYPELYPERLAASPHLDAIRRMTAQGRPVYAECGGMLLLCRKMLLPDGEFPMAGLLEADAHFAAKPQGLGYALARAVRENPWHPTGLAWTGHEFHYTWLEFLREPQFELALKPGVGMGKGWDGLGQNRLWAGYTHLYAPAVPHWAKNFVNLALV